jgi:hypothetical protein
MVTFAAYIATNFIYRMFIPLEQLSPEMRKSREHVEQDTQKLKELAVHKPQRWTELEQNISFDNTGAGALLWCMHSSTVRTQ